MRLSLYRTSPQQAQAQPPTPRGPVQTGRGWKRRAMQCAAAIFILGGGILGGSHAWQARDTITQATLARLADAGLRLERVEIDGRFNTDRDAIMRIAGINWYDPMPGLDLQAIHDRLAAISWVEAVRVERRLPDTLRITLVERTALALLQTPQGHRVIDREGRIIHGIAAEDFTHLPVIKGEGAAQNAEAILAILKTEPELYAGVWSLSYRSQRRWDVFLRNNIRIQLPEADPGAAWKKLARMDREHRLTERDLVNIDLRIPGKFVIRTIKSESGDNKT